MISKVWQHRKRVLALLTVITLTGSSGAMGYAAPVRPNVNSGTVVQGTKPPAGPPAEERTVITIEGEEPGAPPADLTQKIPVKAFRIGGEPPRPERARELLKLVEGEAGKEITLGALRELADKVAKYLQAKGYIAASAYIPAQEIRDGIVEIAVRPGRYGKITIDNKSITDSGRIAAMLFAVKPGEIIYKGTLVRALRLISDLNDTDIDVRLKKEGKTAGVADLHLTITGGPRVSGQAYVDNWGNYYTGRVEYGTQAAVNLSGFGDRLNLGGTTTGQGVNTYMAGYSVPLGLDGLKAEVRHSHVNYRVGKESAFVGASGWATTTSYSLRYPFVRGAEASFFGTVGYDVKHLRDDVAIDNKYSPRSSGLWSFGLNGDFLDTWLGGGMNVFSLTRYWGSLSFQNAAERAFDAATAQTGGSFGKTVVAYQRLQPVTPNLNFSFNFLGQLADKNLDSSEQFSLGGADGVRAYGQGEALGDQGYKLTAELSWGLKGWSDERNDCRLNAFYDYGSVMLHKRPPSGPDPNRRSLMGAGLGLSWARAQAFSVRLDHAWAIGRDPTGTDNGFTWLQVQKFF